MHREIDRTVVPRALGLEDGRVSVGARRDRRAVGASQRGVREQKRIRERVRLADLEVRDLDRVRLPSAAGRARDRPRLRGRVRGRTGLARCWRCLIDRSGTRRSGRSDERSDGHSSRCRRFVRSPPPLLRCRSRRGFWSSALTGPGTGRPLTLFAFRGNRRGRRLGRGRDGDRERGPGERSGARGSRSRLHQLLGPLRRPFRE